MTSSLVGSEMCIRDSATCVRCGLPVQPVIGSATDATSEHHGVWRKLQLAVSYTHLTLPTICSV
eukprot:5836052-Prorocentrum_lima.AAC.1